MILEIFTNPNEILRKPAKEVEAKKITSPKFQGLINNLIQTMRAADGIGIAGPQVGESWQVIIVEKGEHSPLALINPKIISKSFLKTDSEEGCLSIPGVYGIVRRHKAVKVKALDSTGKEVVVKAKGLFASVLQHEIDHLNGILFIDKAKTIFKTEIKKIKPV